MILFLMSVEKIWSSLLKKLAILADYKFQLSLDT